MSTENEPVICAIEDGVVIATLLVPMIRESEIIETLKRNMLQAIDTSEARSVIINFKEVRFMASSAFLAFLAVRRRMGGGRVVFCEISPEITEILTLCRLSPSSNVSSAPFEVALSLKEARERCGLV